MQGLSTWQLPDGRIVHLARERQDAQLIRPAEVERLHQTTQHFETQPDTAALDLADVAPRHTELLRDSLLRQAAPLACSPDGGADLRPTHAVLILSRGDCGAPYAGIQASGNSGSAYVVATIQSRLRTLREKRGLTQEAMGEALGVTRSYVSKTEAGLVGMRLSVLEQYLGLCGYTLELQPLDGTAAEPSLSTEHRELIAELAAVLPVLPDALVEDLRHTLRGWRQRYPR